MSVMNTAPSDRPTWGTEVEVAGARIGAPPLYGPPVAFLAGPWLLLVLLLIPPFALLFVVVLALAAAAVALVLSATVLASPYLLVRHLRAHWAGQATPATPLRLFRNFRVSAGRLGSPQAKGVS